MTTRTKDPQVIPGAPRRRRTKKRRPIATNQTLVPAAIIPDTQKEMALVPTSAMYSPGGLAERLKVYSSVREQFINWIRKEMTPGVDFQLLHRKVGPRENKRNCPNARDSKSHSCPECGGKATLCKPGSEKITALLQLRPRFRKDTETLEMIGGGAGTIALVCELVNVSTGEVVAEGRGARKLSQDDADVNKCVKMTQKSAQTDAVLRCAGISEIFTQDLEDMPREIVIDGEHVDTHTGEIKPAAGGTNGSNKTASGHATFEPATERVNFGKYGPKPDGSTQGMFWIELPHPYLEWLETNASRSDIKEKVKATLRHIENAKKIHEAVTPAQDVLNEMFPETPAPTTPSDIDMEWERLTTGLDDVARSRDTEKITTWATINRASIQKQNPERQDSLRRSWRAAMDEARKLEKAASDKAPQGKAVTK